MTMMVVAREVNRANTLRIAVIASPTITLLIVAGQRQPGGSQLNLAAPRTQRDQRRRGRNIITGYVRPLLARPFGVIKPFRPHATCAGVGVESEAAVFGDRDANPAMIADDA